MTKQKIYIGIIIILLLCNAWALYKLNHRPLSIGPRDTIIERLNFDIEQISIYDTLIHGHRRQIRAQEKSLHETKNSLYQLLKTDTLDRLQAALLLEKIAQIQMNIERIHISHFNDIKNICKPNQLPQYIKLVDELAKLFNHKRKPEKKTLK
ncbi:MAG: hypothetical protein Q8R57_05070 [Bacteroidota bacterium]|nr:hypothetical protein [Bacteroidota bacterium]